jgi:hypothetical protein
MANALITIAGHPVSRLELHVPGVGPWFADADMAGVADGLTGRVTLLIGALALSGTVRVTASGTFGDRRRVRVVAGADGWGKLVPRQSYHNDAGVKASVVAEDAARLVGETIGSFAGGSERLSADYAREPGPASTSLENAARGVAWWVDYAGVTRVGARESVAAESGSYTVREYDPRHREVLLGVEDLSKIVVGSTLSDERLGEPLIIRSLEVIAGGDGLRVTAWCPATPAGQSQLADTLRAIVSRVTDRKLHGVWRYRVVRMSAERVDAQAVRAAAGLPDLLTIPMWGAPGVHAELTPGAEVLVQFIEGDRELPVITHFAGKGGQGHVPVSLVLAGGKRRAARQGDLVQVGGPGTMCTLMPVSGVGAPPNNAIVAGIPCFISFDTTPPAPPGLTAKPLNGAIMTASPLVLVP